MALSKYENRINNLLKRAARGEGTPEGDLCRAKAFELAAKYAIDPDKCREDAGFTATRWEVKIAGKYRIQQLDLLSHISTALHCRVLRSMGGPAGYLEVNVFGRPQHLERVTMLFPILNLNMLAGAHHYAAQSYTIDAAETKRLKTSWMLGFAHSIFDLLYKADADTAEAYGHGASIALRDDKEAAQALLDDYLADLGANVTKAARSKRQIDRAALAAGTMEGSRVDIGNTRMANRRELSA